MLLDWTGLTRLTLGPPLCYELPFYHSSSSGEWRCYHLLLLLLCKSLFCGKIKCFLHSYFNYYCGKSCVLKVFNKLCYSKRAVLRIFRLSNLLSVRESEEGSRNYGWNSRNGWVDVREEIDNLFYHSSCVNSPLIHVRKNGLSFMYIFVYGFLANPSYTPSNRFSLSPSHNAGFAFSFLVYSPWVA
jgi:hypothetical protein